MLDNIDQNWLAVLVISIVAIIVLFLEFRRRRRGTYRIEQDTTGFWRYHKETQFERKIAVERQKKISKKTRKERKELGLENKAIAVLNFDGDIRAKQHRTLAALVDEVTLNQEHLSEVVIVINSPGGMVSTYGHAFSELERIRRSNLPLTVCIDVVAASGGYLMSLPANKIVAAPFAMVGSVGVMAFIPNVRKLLQNWDINPRTFTAGKLKRTVTLTDDASPEEVARFQSQLDSIHQLFLSVVRKYRPGAKMEQIETGDHWTAQESVDQELGLIDVLGTSNEYLLDQNKTKDLVFITQKRSLFDEGLGKFFSYAWDKLESKLYWLF